MNWQKLMSMHSDYKKYHSEKNTIEELDYKKKFPLGYDKRTGELVYTELKKEDRLGIFGPTGSGKTFLTKSIISRYWKAGFKVVHASDIKNDFWDLNYGKGIAKDKMNLLYNEKRQPIPVKMYMPKFLYNEYPMKKTDNGQKYRGAPNYLIPFTFSFKDFSQSDLIELMSFNDKQRDLFIRVYDQIGKNPTYQDFYNVLKEIDANTNTKKAVKNALSSLEKQEVVSTRYKKNPLADVNQYVIALALENYDKYQYSGSKKIELYIGLLLRKVLEMLRNGEVDNDICVVIDEAHTFCPSGEESLSKKQIVQLVNMGRSYGVPMIFSTQHPSQLPPPRTTRSRYDVIGQMKKFFIAKTLDPDERKYLLKKASIWSPQDTIRNKWTRIIKSMDKYEWMYIDVEKNTYRIIQPLSPLCAHTS